MVGYIFLGIPCGILSQSVGMDALQVFLLSALFYSGAGQYMIPNMWLLGSPMAAIIASVTLVNSRQMLYSASLSRFCENVNKRLAFLYGATVTDESFAVNVVKLEQGEWNIKVQRSLTCSRKAPGRSLTCSGCCSEACSPCLLRSHRSL